MMREPTFSADFKQEVSNTNGMTRLTDKLRDVKMSDLELPERAGWLYDQGEHKNVWCVIADMLFCVFDSETSEKPNIVVLLPGCSIRSLVYRTVNSKVVSSKTISGIDKFQIIIDDCASRKKYLFSLDTHFEQEEWMTLLKSASKLDEDSESCLSTDPRRHSIAAISSRPQGSFVSPTYTPSSKSHTGNRSLYAWNNPSDEKDDSDVTAWSRNQQVRNSIGDIRRKLRRENESECLKPVPIKATHFETSESQDKKAASFKKIRSFGSLESLFRPKRRNGKSEETADCHSLDDTSKTSDISKQSSLTKSDNKRLSQSLDFGKSEKGLSKGLVRTASDLKDRLLKSAQDKNTSTKIRLKELKDISISGYLQYKHLIKWQKRWCVISKGCLYGFKSQNGDESADLMVILTRCEVAYISDQDKRFKKLYVFKLTQRNKKSIYLNACDYADLSGWLQILQMESSKIQCDSDLKDQETNISSPLCSNGFVMELPKTDLRKRHSFPNGFMSGCEDTFSSSADDSECPVGITNYHKAIAPQHDETLKQVWEKDKNYLFNVVRAKLSSYKQKSDITNKDINGSKGDGLHIVSEDKTLAQLDKESGGSTGREVRRSHSFHIKTRSDMADDDCPESPVSTRKRHKPLTVKKISTSSLGECTVCGHLERRLVNGEWIRYWYALKNGTLFSFLTENDTVTVDIQDLHRFKVSRIIDQFRGKRFAIKLTHEDVTSTFLSAETRDVMELWVENLESATGHPPSEHSLVDGNTNNQNDNYKEKCQTVKQKLLEEMLRQKRELQLKQAARQKKQQSTTETSGGYVQDDQLISDVIRLRQRRMSTQIKMDTIQKQIQSQTPGRRFPFGKKKKVDENKTEIFQEQLRELNDKLQTIDKDIRGKEMLDVNQNKKPLHLNHSEDSVFLSNGTSVDHLDDGKRDEEINGRGNSLNFKNSVQKLAQKTKRSIKGKSKKLMEVPKLNGLVTMNGGSIGALNIDTSRDDDEEDTDLSDLRDSCKSTNSLIDLTKTQISITSDDVFDNKSETSLSPRKEIDPTVMAEIDAFEELTRQVLNARAPPT